VFSSDLIDLFEKSIFNILNLEIPITKDNKENRIIKTDPYLRSDSSTVIPRLKKLNIDLVTLANNHIMNYGISGLEDTIDSLTDSNINFTGIRKNSATSSLPFIYTQDETTIAILNFAENEWANSQENIGGANPLDVQSISRAK